MKPKMRNDTLFLPVENGIYLLNNRDTFVLNGRAVYDWVARLQPLLDGTRELVDLVHGLPPDRADYVRDLVYLLHEKGFVKDVGGDRPSSLTPAKQDLYAAEIAFIDYYLDSAAHRFENVQNARVSVVGWGLMLVCLLRAVLQVGVGAVQVVCTRPDRTDLGWLTDEIDSRRRVDPDQHVGVQTGSPPVDPTKLVTVADTDLVLHVADASEIEQSTALARRCHLAGVGFAAATIMGDVAFAGPFSRGPGDVDWAQVWTRLRRAPAGPTRFLTVPVASIVASQLAFEAFKGLAGIPDTDLDGRVMSLDLETLESRTHPALPAVLEPGPGAPERWESRERFEERLRALRVVDQTDDEFSLRARRIIDEYTGVLHNLDERDIAQLPLNVAEVTWDSEQGIEHVIGVGDTVSDARRLAVRRALNRCAGSSTDPGRCAGIGRVWGQDLRADAPVMLPSDIITNAGPGVTASAGTWGEAVRDGLLLACAGLTLATPRPAFRFAVPAEWLDDRSRLDLRRLEILGCVPETFDATPPGGVPTVVFTHDGDVVSCIADGDPGALIGRGLRDCVERAQALRHDSGTVTAPVHALQFRDSGGPGPWTSLPEQAGAAFVVNWLLDRFDCTVRPIAVPLDHDPAIREACPCIVRIVLVNDHDHDRAIGR